MEIGLFKNRIAFYSYSKSADGYGGYTNPTPTLITTIWGYKKELGGDYSSEDGKRRKNNDVEVVVRKKDFALVNVTEFSFNIDGVGKYRVNDVYESEIDKYITIRGLFVS
tara:strand:- start:403 stop:732 length:330 start_codon:yes stop_codon:yes gene_type:complete